MCRSHEDRQEGFSCDPSFFKIGLALNFAVFQYEVLQDPDMIVDVPVVVQRQVPTIQTVQKTLEVSKVQFLDRVVDVPVVTQRQVPQERIQERIGGKSRSCEVPSTGTCAEQHRGATR